MTHGDVWRKKHDINRQEYRERVEILKAHNEKWSKVRRALQAECAVIDHQPRLWNSFREGDSLFGCPYCGRSGREEDFNVWLPEGLQPGMFFKLTETDDGHVEWDWTQPPPYTVEEIERSKRRAKKLSVLFDDEPKATEGRFQLNTPSRERLDVPLLSATSLHRGGDWDAQVFSKMWNWLKRFVTKGM